ncbi:Swt1 family HEPN domain-containing protein [Mycolicibacterium smegmatis]|uniref:Swt1-like HEPN domain-containing protein n=2 Tax=Mycolicibacterium smegmatis (strain ATCC 700084 / mc(2)155) TaxID=246196 RepID=I7FFP8_MYCS2|nr:Swt1 family HEPN domain-containing protein [Mycolicibacterium smegmatis]AFP37688.1 hypothetical protein MSMEI_1212 [Mycolicibacterium smegmatis MC2 155]AIU06492.1 hypothetical protein LJ00_06215 [Mycolicibacterium smegmatis MC2 155]AIU13117.1 hypothetical protein LI99_06215 [Mycolicibacterium smegmatis]AIU19741.1 hypothetical protein LI98_06215 [Mycolicibacterium smegmatis]MBE9622041.1 hypothetical protein [Mycolicibacterium smegmatis]
MAFKPNLSVKEGLDHLAKRLDPIIAGRLAQDLGDQPWTVVLEILDSKKGFVRGRKYGTHDLQAQLRMITERLGDFGFPFDDRQRTVSTLGNELRIVRNQMAHMHEFTVEEAFRASDFGVRLLEHFADHDGLDEARRIRHEALVAFASAEGVTEESAAASAVTIPMESIEEERNDVDAAVSEESEGTTELITPDPEVFVREPTVIGDKRLGFEPWKVVQVGGVEILDELPKKAAKEMVRSVAVEIATYEGPIHLDRLLQMTAQSFGLKRVRASREKKLAYQVRQAGLFVDVDKFVWPTEIDPGSWAEFRPNDSTVDRPFQHISPLEVANAARFIRAQRSDVSDEELFTAVLQTFGRRRKTKQILAHLQKVRSHL